MNLRRRHGHDMAYGSLNDVTSCQRARSEYKEGRRKEKIMAVYLLIFWKVRKRIGKRRERRRWYLGLRSVTARLLLLLIRRRRGRHGRGWGVVPHVCEMRRGWGRRRGPGCVLAWVLSRILRPLARQRQISVAAEIDATFPLSTWPVALWELWWRWRRRGSRRHPLEASRPRRRNRRQFFMNV